LPENIEPQTTSIQPFLLSVFTRGSINMNCEGINILDETEIDSEYI
jgi:hypothetical protein